MSFDEIVSPKLKAEALQRRRTSEKMTATLTNTHRDNTILSVKQKLRKEILEKLKSQDKKTALTKSRIIKKKLFGLEEFKKAKCVVFYVSMEEEVDTHEMIDEGIRLGKTIGVPVVVKGKMDLSISQITDRTRQLEAGPYGIRQPRAAQVRPISCEETDLVLVPGLLFDRNGNRLGRGKGYYDRFLSGPAKGVFTVGLCFDFQVSESIPKLPHDIPVRVLLTN